MAVHVQTNRQNSKSARLEKVFSILLLSYNQAKSIQTANDDTAENSTVVLTQLPIWTASRAEAGFYQLQAIRPMLFSSGRVACFVIPSAHVVAPSTGDVPTRRYDQGLLRRGHS